MVDVGCAAVSDVSVLHHIALAPRRRRAPNRANRPNTKRPMAQTANAAL